MDDMMTLERETQTDNCLRKFTIAAMDKFNKLLVDEKDLKCMVRIKNARKGA